MSAAPKHKSLILLTERLSPAEVIDSHICAGYNHIVQRDGHEFDKESVSAALCESDPKKLFSDPAEVILGKHNILFETQFSKASEKDLLSNGIEAGLAMLNLTGSFSSELHLVANELFTNAVYNAPAIDLKTKLNPGIARNTVSTAMHAGKFGKMFLAQDDSRLAMGCLDPYGTLDIKAYLEKVLGTYEVGAGSSMNFGSGGAGIGSYIIFNTGCSLYLGVDPGHATVVCCVFPLKMSGRQRANLPKHLHLVQF
jgi:hypothetical protein